jgi:predicted Fe-S protein YdhL (DUF1289 family)
MTRRPLLRSIAAVFASLGCAWSFVACAQPGQGEGQPPLSPEQRRLWQQLTPEQREAFRAARTPEERQNAWQQLTPEQRRDMWQRLSPEQRELMLRRIPRDERREMWQKMSPQEREAMRQRFLQRNDAHGANGDAAHRLTPEERQRLRDQIREAQKGWKDVPKKGDGR